MYKALAVLLLCVSLQAAEPLQALAPSIRLPQLPASLTAPTPVSRLGKEQLYVIEADADIMVLPSPLGVVRTTSDEGPLRIKGLFADGNGEYETRTYKGKKIVTVEAATTGRVELIIVPIGGNEAAVIRRTLEVDAGKGPQPPPVPPVPVAGKLSNWVIVEETDQASENRGDINAAAIAWSKSNGVKWTLTDQNARQYDPVTKADITPPDLVTYLNDAKGKKLPRLYLVNDKGEPLWMGDRPGTPAAMVDLLNKYKGQ